MREGCERGQEERALELLVAVDVATRRDAESQDDEPLELWDTLTFVTPLPGPEKRTSAVGHARRRCSHRELTTKIKRATQRAIRSGDHRSPVGAAAVIPEH